MNARTLRMCAMAALCFALPRAEAVTYTSADLFVPGNNAVGYTIPPDPRQIIVKTDAEIRQAVTTVAFPSGILNNAAGITVLVHSHLASVAAELNALNLTVGSTILRQYSPGNFSDVYGIYAANVFGFADFSLISGFGIVGTPIYFGIDNGSENATSGRFSVPGVRGGFTYYANPLTQQVPEGLGLPAMALCLTVMAAIHRRRAAALSLPVR